MRSAPRAFCQSSEGLGPSSIPLHSCGPRGSFWRLAHTPRGRHMADDDDGDILRIMIASDNHLGYMVMRARAPRRF